MWRSDNGKVVTVAIDPASSLILRNLKKHLSSRKDADILHIADWLEQMTVGEMERIDHEGFAADVNESEYVQQAVPEEVLNLIPLESFNNLEMLKFAVDMVPDRWRLDVLQALDDVVIDISE